MLYNVISYHIADLVEGDVVLHPDVVLLGLADEGVQGVLELAFRYFAL